MKTFKEFLIENADGNYVCIDCEDLGAIWHAYGVDEPVTGESPPDGDYHCTLIYSKETYMSPSIIFSSLHNAYGDLTVMAQTKGVDCFDSVPKDGERDSEKSCIVLKLQSNVLDGIHDQLKGMGLKHSYPTFTAHVTLRYNMSVEEAHFYRDKINSSGIGPKYVQLHGFKSQAINKNYV